MSEEIYETKDSRHTVRVAVFISLERDGKVFLMRRSNTKWAAGLLTLPSGHVELGEKILDAAVREVKEEAGVIVKPEDLEFMHVHYVQDIYSSFYFRATAWEGEAYRAEPELCSEVLWESIDALPKDTISQVRFMYKSYKEGIAFSNIENDPTAL